MLEVRSEKLDIGFEREYKMIKSYRDLRVYEQSYELGKIIHQVTQEFPKEEQYEMGSQLRRAALSIPLNIAEGFGKKHSVADFKIYFDCNGIL